MYYAIFDTQTGCYLATGYNSKSKDEVADAYINYVATEIDRKEEIEDMLS